MVDQVSFQSDPGIVADHKDIRDGLILNTYVDGQRVIGMAQPTIWNPDGIRTASEAIAVCLQSLQATRYMVDSSDSTRLHCAIVQANDAVRTRNRMRVGHQHEEAIGVGIVLALRNGKSATVALLPPAQMVLMQGLSIKWVPELESWNGPAAGLNGSPLGWTAVPKPSFVRTQVDPGDEIAAISQVIAEATHSHDLKISDSETLCRAISELGDRSTTGTEDMVAVVTRFEPPSLSRNVRSATGAFFGRTDRRARAVWAALRTSAPAEDNKKPRANDSPGVND